MSTVSITRRPLQPKVTLTKNDATTYVCDPFSPSYDFKVRRLQCSPPFDAAGGKFTVTIIGNDASAANTNTILTNISEGNEVLIGIGKTAATNVFRGAIERISINENTFGYMELEISGPDWGSDILNHRIVNGAWIQKTNSSGDLDGTDDTVLISQIVSDLVTQTWPYPAADVAVDDQGIVYSSSNVIVPGLRLPQFYANMEFLDDKLQELDAIGGTIHYVDVAKNYIMRSPTNATSSSNVIIVDDYSDATALAWDSTKVGLIGEESKYIKTTENRKARVFGLGGDQRSIDQSSTTDSAGTDMDSNYIAMRFTPDKGFGQRCESIGILAKKVGTPTTNLVLELVEDSNNTPKGSVIRSADKVPGAFTTTAQWHYFPIGVELNTGINHWIVLRKNGSAGNTYNWRHDNGTSASHSVSADGVSWVTDNTAFSYAFIERVTTPLLTIYPQDGSISSTTKVFREDIIRKPDITQSELMQYYIRAEFETLKKRKEIFKCKIYAPDTLLQTGQTVRIRKNTSAYTVDGEFVIGSLTYVFDDSDNTQTGSFWYDLEATRFTAFP